MAVISHISIYALWNPSFVGINMKYIFVSNVDTRSVSRGRDYIRSLEPKHKEALILSVLKG